jgi:hypothetical protein
MPPHVPDAIKPIECNAIVWFMPPKSRKKDKISPLLLSPNDLIVEPENRNFHFTT